MRRVQLSMAIAGAIAAGGAAAVMLFTSGIANAASPSASVVPSAVASAVASLPAAVSSTAPAANNPFPRTETVSDASVVANAIGITEAQLNAALASGQTVAAIAEAHGVTPQKVIDALVADGLTELAAEVKAGTITQAQADAMKVGLTQRATDQVSGTLSGRGGPGGAGCPNMGGTAPHA